jgi:geranylgeranyl diphosphate synthase type I
MVYNELFDYLADIDAKIASYLQNDEMNALLKPEDIYAGATGYLYRPAKRLRPAVLLMSCGCFNGAVGENGKIREIGENAAMPAAAGIELFHTWTIVHDDLIDNDSMRRGKPSIHSLIEGAGKQKLRLNDKDAKEYGRNIAILAGDILQAWSIKSFASLADSGAIHASVALKLVKILETEVICNLLCGEALDVQYSFSRIIHNNTDISENEIIRMLWLKTGVLFSFAAMAGAMIGKNTADENDAEVASLKAFASYCGTAFQLQDDILGVIGGEAALGKPIGSDIREGKKTTIIIEALRNANSRQKSQILSALGNRSAKQEDIDAVKSLAIELNGIGYTKQLARKYINDAMPHLGCIGESQSKKLLKLWADYMIDRDF